jgi:hypothetical protein
VAGAGTGGFELDQLPAHAGVDFIHGLAASDEGDGAALSGEGGFFDEPNGVGAAEGFPIEAVGSVETDFGFRGWAVGPLSGAEEDVHPFGFGNPIRMRDDDCELRSGFAKVVGVDVSRLHISVGDGIRTLRASLVSSALSDLV